GPVEPLAQEGDRAGVTPNANLPSVRDGRRVSVAGLVLVRQRPGKGNAIFLTLEDDKAVANVIFWQRTFDRYRPVVMGARFVKVTGKLQSESGVVHIVAEKIEDLTPWLTVLLEKVSEAAPAAVSSPERAARVPDRSSRPAIQDKPIRQDLATLSEEAERVMPKGRNFQ
ncbi:error-prone DNA polymerase, partial [Mesorhizobium sp. M7D.F.Ca.US.004.03.1.1]|uniref:OB-fold nucleic acid binding domain-containing protein n=1 Tax=Mesorhizobium sp. M7D.F.Ca.US.004.03.1.1 TaxID=2496702 RepID=UPI000FD26343